MAAIYEKMGLNLEKTGLKWGPDGPEFENATKDASSRDLEDRARFEKALDKALEAEAPNEEGEQLNYPRICKELYDVLETMAKKYADKMDITDNNLIYGTLKKHIQVPIEKPSSIYDDPMTYLELKKLRAEIQELKKATEIIDYFFFNSI